MYKPNPIANAFLTPGLLYRIIKNLQHQKEFIQKNIVPEIEAVKKINDGSLDETDIKKMTGYYGLAVPAILGEAFCALRGEPMTEKERLASTCQGATTGQFDDFFDKQNISKERLEAFIEKPEEMTGKTANEKLFLQLYKTGLQNIPDRELMLAHIYRVYHSQIESKKQAAPGLSFDEIKKITLLKGGESVVFYRVVFASPMEKEEEEVLMKLGGLMQLSNDIFDIYKDLDAGINTLITTTKNVNDIRRLFIALLKEGYDAAYNLNYKKQHIKKMLSIFSIGVFSRCFVCLDHLEKSECLSDNVFTPHFYNRNQLVCDMDTAANKLKSVKYHIKYTG